MNNFKFNPLKNQLTDLKRPPLAFPMVTKHQAYAACILHLSGLMLFKEYPLTTLRVICNLLCSPASLSLIGLFIF